MKRDILQLIWTIILFSLLIGLLVWSIWYIDKVENKISVFGIVAVIMAAFTSVWTVSINNKKAKERDYELIVLKEKQAVYEHFYNALFEAFNQLRKGNKGLSNKSISEMMLFKQGLMNWGSERLINKFIEYENKMVEKKDTFNLIKDGDIFLKEIRKDMGFRDSKDLNLVSIILTAEARQELINNKSKK